MIKLKIFIEGGPTMPKNEREKDLRAVNIQQDLRRAWRRLFESYFSVNGVAFELPIIIEPVGSYPEAVKRFKEEITEQKALLLVDLDEHTREKWLKLQGLTDYGHNIFFMIQTLEAWFISQYSIIDIAFEDKRRGNKSVVSFIPLHNHPEEISTPKKVVIDILGECFGISYKTKIQTLLIDNLDIHQLRKTFTDVDDLLNTIVSINR